MKKIFTFILAAVLIISLTACGNFGGATLPAESAATTTTSTPTPKHLSRKGETLPNSVIYAEEYELQSDPGEYLSAYDAAILLYEATSDSLDYKSITLTGLEVVSGGECYLYRATDINGAFTNYAVNYQNGDIFIRYEESGEYDILTL